jgi:hypothetical protein
MVIGNTEGAWQIWKGLFREKEARTFSRNRWDVLSTVYRLLYPEFKGSGMQGSRCDVAGQVENLQMTFRSSRMMTIRMIKLMPPPP